MISIEEVEAMLDELALELPQEFYKDLNGGIILLPEAKLHEKNINNDLFILGEYHRNQAMGKFIVIYYGSFSHVFGYLSSEQIKKELRKTLRHEFRHHIESLAGERGLEIQDAKDIKEYENNRSGH